MVQGLEPGDDQPHDCDIGGLSPLDLELARRIDALLHGGAAPSERLELQIAHLQGARGLKAGDQPQFPCGDQGIVARCGEEKQG